MAACVIADQIDASGCYANGALTEHQQKLALLYYYWAWARSISAGPTATINDLTEFAKCWQPLTDSQLLAIEIITTRTQASSLASVANVLDSTKCLSALSDPELDRIIGALKCSIWDAL